MAVSAGCDPCAGVVACDSEPKISVEGQLAVHETGEPAAGVQVIFVPTDPAALAVDSVFGLTGANGRYQLSAPSRVDGDVEGKIIIRPPQNEAYEVEGVTLSTRNIRGDGDIISETWVVDPYFDFLAEFYSAETGRPIRVESKVTFRRTGGIQIEPDTFVAIADADGRVVLSPEAVGHGEVVGDVRIEGVVADRFQTLNIPNVRFRTTYVQRPLAVQGVFYVGRTFDYVGAIAYNAQYRAAAGIPVIFRKTAGIERFPEVIEQTTDERGQFRLRFAPEDPGFVRGTLEFDLGPPIGRVEEPLELSTRDLGGEVRLPDLTYGPALNYVGEIRGEQTGNALTGREVRVRKLSGISIEEDEYTDTVNADGRFRLNPRPYADGSVTLEVTVDLPDPMDDFVRVLELETFRETKSRLAAVWYVPGL